LEKEAHIKENIAAIIACRLKSTRLPKKAILKIGDISSIELCIKNTLKINNLNNVVLATSFNKEDEVLAKYIYDESVIYHQGHPDNVVLRYLEIIDKLKTEVFLELLVIVPM